MKRLVSVLLLALMLGAVASMPVAAQDATPISPAPELCTLTPPTYEQVSAYAASPVAEVTAEAEATPGAELTLPEGTPLDDETRDAVEQSMIVNVACINSGSILYQIAAYSDRFVSSQVGGLELDQATYESWATPIPTSEEEWLVIVEFQDMVLLEDGRVAALIVGDDPSNDAPGGPTLFYLAETDGHWYIDDFVNPSE